MSNQRLDSPFLILARDQIHHLHAIRKQSEQQAVINADALAHDAGTRLEPDRADERRRLTRGQPSEHGHRAARQRGPAGVLRRAFDEGDFFGCEFIKLKRAMTSLGEAEDNSPRF